MNIYAEGRKALINMSIFISTGILASIIHPTKWYLILMFSVASIFAKILHRIIYKKKIVFKQVITGIIFIAIMINMLAYLSKYLPGWVGFILITFLLSFFILYKRRKEWLWAKHYLETMIWGKPLKEFVENKEKLPKLKFKIKK